MTATAPTLQNFIGSEFVDSAEGETEPVLNPSTGEVIAHAPVSTAADVDRAVGAARGALDGWATTTPGERANALLRLADALEEHADEISELESDNAGKPINAFREDELPFMADNLRFFAGAGRCLEGRAAGEYLGGYTSIIRREPVGVIGQIVPWNHPLMIAGTGYYNAGQDCTAATRVLASARVHDDVVAGLVEQAQGLVLGDTRSPDTTLGPLNSARQRERVEGFLSRAPSHVSLATGGQEPDRPGFFLEP